MKDGEGLTILHLYFT